MLVAGLIVIVILITVMSFGKYSGSKKAVDLLTLWLDMDMDMLIIWVIWISTWTCG